jgi:hypothetical protein
MKAFLLSLTLLTVLALAQDSDLTNASSAVASAGTSIAAAQAYIANLQQQITSLQTQLANAKDPIDVEIDAACQTCRVTVDAAVKNYKGLVAINLCCAANTVPQPPLLPAGTAIIYITTEQTQ